MIHLDARPSVADCNDIVTVIMPVYNAQASLSRAVASVRLQEYRHWELLLIEDGSVDTSLQMCRTYTAEDTRIRLIENGCNRGAAAARNAGLAEVQGRYVAFLDADDEWLPCKLSRQIAFMQAQGAVLSYSDFLRRDPKRGDHRVQVPQTVTQADLMRGNVIGCLTAMYDRDYFGDVSMPAMAYSEDYAFWLQLLARTPQAHGLQDVLAVYHVTAGSLSSNRTKALRATWQIYRQHLGLTAIGASWCLVHHLVRRLRRG